MKPVTDWIKHYAAIQTAQPASVAAVKAMNYLMAIQTGVVGFLLLSPGELFMSPSSPPDAAWLAPSLFGIGAWEALFLVGAVLLVGATSVLKGVVMAHTFLAVSWGAFAVVWTIGGVLSSPSYLFGVGILGIFIALQHIALIGVWRAEGV